MENEIHDQVTTLVTALERGDAAAAGVVYTDGARLLASTAEPIDGRAEIEAYWRAGIELGLFGVTFESRVLEWIGAGALELGRYAVSMQGRSPTPTVEHGSHLVLHTQTSDGSWKRAVEVFNPDEPQPGSPNPKEEQ